ncbi:hypothetical protein [Holdemanella biformis]
MGYLRFYNCRTTGYDKDEVFQYDEATRKIIADLWSRVKVAASNAH